MKDTVNIFWFRRDLRLEDNAGLYHALRSAHPVVPLFIFDTNILDELEDRIDRRVEFIHAAIEKMQQQLLKIKSTIDVRHGKPADIFKELVRDYTIADVYTNNDYEPYATKRDETIAAFLKQRGAGFHSYKDQVIFEKNEVIKDDLAPYSIFTPYARRWRSIVNEFYLSSYPAKKYHSNFYRQKAKPVISLAEMNFKPGRLPFPPKTFDENIIRDYKKHRDYPGVHGTTRLSVHLRFGTVSIRGLAREAIRLNNTFLNELIWRDFYQMILWHAPGVVTQSFRREYDNIEWRNNEQEFDAWCGGMTGYPIVDAGMRELNATGFMHNRVRMITASFLTRHLLIDWRWGEAYFGQKLLDYDLAANNGGWQWCAGTGADAAPYFRVFNPTLQTKKFDPDLHYIRKWIPELDDFSYPTPIVEHEFARNRCLAAYKKALKK